MGVPGELWIIDRHKGQLGNRLMFFAAAYAFARAEGRALKFPTFHRYAEFFPRLGETLFCDPDGPGFSEEERGDWPAERLGAFRQAWVDRRRLLAKLRVLPGVLRKPSGVAAVALPPTWEGFPSRRQRRAKRLYMTAWRYFNPAGLREHRGAILEALRLREDLEREAEEFVGGLERGRLWIAAHVRGKDYHDFLGGKHFHTLEVTIKHLRAAAERFADRRPGFVVFSDEPRTKEQFAGLDVVISGGSAIEDFARMSRLKLLIGPMSTFTAFAMYRAGGAAWHIGPSCEEDGLGWVYAGYPVVRSLDEFAAAEGVIARGERFEGAFGAGRVDPMPRKRG